MSREGAIRKGRADFFLKLKFHHNLILHEAGVPPIHTPISILANFDDDVKKRLYLVHTSQKSVPSDSGLFYEFSWNFFCSFFVYFFVFFYIFFCIFFVFLGDFFIKFT